MDVPLLEGIAREAWESTGGILPADAFELAHLCGLECVPWPKTQGALDGDRIWYPLKARPTRQHGTVAHELGHWLAGEHGLNRLAEPIARYLAGALLLPRHPFTIDCQATDYDLDALELRHPNASAEMIVVRMTQVSPATAWVWDNAKLARTYGVPDDGDSVAAIVDRVLTLEEPCLEGPVRAWPRFDGRWRRVLVVKRAA